MNSLKLPKGWPKTTNRRHTDNAMAKTEQQRQNDKQWYTTHYKEN